VNYIKKQTRMIAYIPGDRTVQYARYENKRIARPRRTLEAAALAQDECDFRINTRAIRSAKGIRFYDGREGVYIVLIEK